MVATLGVVAAVLVSDGTRAGSPHTSAMLAITALREPILAGAPVLAPFAYLEFCQRTPQDCVSDGRAARIELTPERLRELLAVNEAVNRRIAPSIGLTNEQAWSLTAQKGNCNTFALQKRHELLVRGWPVGNLSLAVVTTPTGAGHLVLVIRDLRGDVVLDNLRADVRDWSRTGYRWHKIQSLGRSDDWVKVTPAFHNVAALVE